MKPLKTLPMTQSWEGDWFYRLMQFAIVVLSMIFFRLRAYGRENIPARGGLLIASTHQSFLDPPLVGSLTRRESFIMARESLFTRNRLFGAMIRYCRAFPVKRGSLGLDAIRNTIELLKQGHAVLMFPEGTRSEDGTIRDCHPGALLSAQRAGVPVLPAVIDGACQAWPKRQKWFASKQIKVIFGTPFSVQNMDKDLAAQRLQDSWSQLRRKL